MLAKHMHLHLRLEAADGGEAGLGVRQVGDAGLEVEEALDVGVDVAFLLEVSQGGAEMVGVIAVGVTARKDFHEGVVGGGIPLGGYSRSSVLEDGKCPGEAFLRGELLGVVDKLQLPAPVSELAASIEGGRVELESGARRLLGLLGLVEGSGELLQGLDQLLELRRGRRLLHGGDVLDDCLYLGGSGFRGCMELLGQVANCGGGVLSQDAHVFRERDNGLEEGGGFHQCKLASRIGEWVPRRLDRGQKSKERENSLSDLRYLLCAYRASRSAFAASILGSVS